MTTMQVFHFYAKPVGADGIRNLIVEPTAVQFETRLGEFPPTSPPDLPMETVITPHPLDHHLFIIEGVGKIRENTGPEHDIYPGCAVFLAANETHSIKNTGQCILRVLSTKAPTGP